MKYEIKTLKNGIRTLFIDSPGSTAASVQVWFRAGSALETKEEEGIAHFLEHMFFKGTKKYPDTLLVEEIEAFGGEVNAFTSFDYTCYYINTPNKFLKKSVHLLMDMVSNPLFKDADLVTEMQVVIEEYKRSVDNPSQFAFNKFQEESFTGKYKHMILGTPEQIMKFNIDKIKNFRKNNYNSKNMLLIVSGDLKDQTKFITEIEQFKIPKGIESNFPNFKLKSKPVVSVHKKDVRMSMLTIAFNSFGYEDKESPAEDLACNCLGHGESSLLYKKMVLESTLANSSSCSTMYFAKGGFHSIRVSFPPEIIEEVLNKLKGVIVEIYEKGVDGAEIRKIKKQYMASKVYDLESLESYVFLLGHSYAQTGDINCEEQFVERIKKVRNSEVNSALRDMFVREKHIFLQIPKDEKSVPAKKILRNFKSSLKKELKESDKRQKKLKKDSASKFDPKLNLIKIKDGVNLLYRQNNITQTFVFHAYVRGGVIEETVQNCGMYNLLGSLLTKGYSGISYDEIKKNLEYNSASITSFSGKNAYGLMSHGMTENFDEILTHFFGAFFKPDFLQKHITHEKKMTYRFFETQKEDPVKKCFDEVNNLIFDNHPYSQNLFGTKKSIRGLKREELLKKHMDNIKKKEIVFTYCGDMDLEEVKDTICKLGVDKLKGRKDKGKSKKYKSKKPVDKFIEFKREQSQLFIFIPSKKIGSFENLVLKMATTYFTGQSSELFIEIRDKKGLCYSVQPVHFMAMDGGYFGIYLASSNDKVNEAKSSIMEILKRMSVEGISKKDFNRVKRVIHGQEMLNVQTNDDYANIYSIPFLQNLGVDFYHESNVKIDNIDYEVFNKKLKSIFSQEWYSIIVGQRS